MALIGPVAISIDKMLQLSSRKGGQCVWHRHGARLSPAALMAWGMCDGKACCAGTEGINQTFNAIFFVTLVLALVPFTYM